MPTPVSAFPQERHRSVLRRVPTCACEVGEPAPSNLVRGCCAAECPAGAGFHERGVTRVEACLDAVSPRKNGGNDGIPIVWCSGCLTGMGKSRSLPGDRPMQNPCPGFFSSFRKGLTSVSSITGG